MEFDWQLPVLTLLILLDSIKMQWRPQFSVQPPCRDVPRVPKDCALPDGGGRDWAKLLRRFSSCLHAACLLGGGQGRQGHSVTAVSESMRSKRSKVTGRRGKERYHRRGVSGWLCPGQTRMFQPCIALKCLTHLEIKMDIIHFIHFMSRPSPGALHGTSSFSSQDQTFQIFPEIVALSLWQSLMASCHFPFLGFQPAKATLFSWDDRLDTTVNRAVIKTPIGGLLEGLYYPNLPNILKIIIIR